MCVTPRSNARRRMRPSRLVRAVAAEVVPEPERDRGQLQAARAAAAVLHRVVAVCGGGVGHGPDRIHPEPADGAATMRGRVRQPVRQAAKRSRRPAEEGGARRGGDLACDARDPARPARSRRQLHGRPRLRRPRPRARARRGGAEEPDAGPAGREDRPRRADPADGRGRVGARVRQVHGHPARGPPGRRARRRPLRSSRCTCAARAASRA